MERLEPGNGNFLKHHLLVQRGNCMFYVWQSGACRVRSPGRPGRPASRRLRNLRGEVQRGDDARGGNSPLDPLLREPSHARSVSTS